MSDIFESMRKHLDSMSEEAFGTERSVPIKTRLLISNLIDAYRNDKGFQHKTLGLEEAIRALATHIGVDLDKP